MAADDESPTAAWRAERRERYAADVARIAQEEANRKAGVRQKPINGANWDAESLGLVTPRIPAAVAWTAPRMTSGPTEEYIRLLVDDYRNDIEFGRVASLEPWRQFLAGLLASFPVFGTDVDLKRELERADTEVRYALERGILLWTPARAQHREPTLEYIRALAADYASALESERATSLVPWQQQIARLVEVFPIFAADGILKWELHHANNKVQWALEKADAVRLERKLAGRIPLLGSTAGIVFGTLVDGGADLVIPLRKMQHQLVVGTTGYGKSVYLHGLIQQILSLVECERVVLIDLKEGGPTFARYRNHPKALVVWEFKAIQGVVEQVMQLMRDRGNAMSAQGVEVWRGGRVVVIVDEFADIQTEVDLAESKEEKLAGKRLLHSLIRISQRARSFGILLICAMQRPTPDAIDPSLRANLPCRICFRVSTSAMASSILDGLDDAPVRPQRLPPGRYIYYDGGRQRLVQAHVAPGIDLGDS